MSIATTIQAIERGDISTYLSANYVSNGALFGARKAPISPVTIAIVTDALRWGYEGGAQTDQSVRNTTNYLVWLTGFFGQQAQAIIDGGGDGGTVIPGTAAPIKSPIMITGSMFATSLGWEGANNDGMVILPSYSLQVFWNGLNRYLIEGYEWARTAKGFDIIVNGETITAFDALGANATDIFFIFISA